MPGIIGVCFPTRFLFTRAGILAGIGVGLATLYVTLIVTPHPFGLHGGVWSVIANFFTVIVVSAVTRRPSVSTVERIHGEIERFVYGEPS